MVIPVNLKPQMAIIAVAFLLNFAASSSPTASALSVFRADRPLWSRAAVPSYFLRSSSPLILSESDYDGDTSPESSPPTLLFKSPGFNDEKMTKLGSSEYYQGFLLRSMNEEPRERVTGDSILGPTLKFAGGVTLILVILTAVFLSSNGII